MALYQIAFRNASFRAKVLLNSVDTPAGYTKVGTFEHGDDEDSIGWHEGHVVYHHVRNALTDIGVYDMHRVTIEDDVIDPIPDLLRSYSDVTKEYNVLRNFKFGTGTAPIGATRIADLTTLAQYFNPLQEGTGSTTINREQHIYQLFTSASNFPFSEDGLNLRATYHNPTGGPTYTALTTTAAVTNDRIIPVNSVTGLRVGMLVDLGQYASENTHLTYCNTIRPNYVTGDVLTHTVTWYGAGRGSVQQSKVFTYTILSTDTHLGITNKVIAQINGDPELAALGIYAINLGSDPGGWCLIAPARKQSKAIKFGIKANRSVRDVNLVVTKTGTVNVNQTGRSFYTYITSIHSGSITVNHPVTLPSGATVNAGPTFVLNRNNGYTAASATIPVDDTTGMYVGQLIQLGSADTNLRYVVSLTSTSFTLNASVVSPNGLMMLAYPATGYVTSAANTADTSKLTFAVWPNAKVGHHVFFYNTTNNVTRLVTAIDEANKTITMDNPISIGSGALVYFVPLVKSAQIWSKDLYLPGRNGNDIIAMELTARFPDNFCFGGWPAWWLYTSNTDTETVGASAAATEIDMVEIWNYSSNTQNNNIKFGIATGTPTAQYSNPNVSSLYLQGNNIDEEDRTVQLIWTATHVFMYVDDVLMQAWAFLPTTYQRCQIGINLAIGSVATSFNSAGHFPMIPSRFPLDYKIKQLVIKGLGLS